MRSQVIRLIVFTLLQCYVFPGIGNLGGIKQELRLIKSGKYTTLVVYTTFVTVIVVLCPIRLCSIYARHDVTG